VPPLSGVSSLFFYISNDFLCTELEGINETRDFCICKLPLTLFDKELLFEYKFELLGVFSSESLILDCTFIGFEDDLFSIKLFLL
jgi:hypothetical protein